MRSRAEQSLAEAGASLQTFERVDADSQCIQIWVDVDFNTPLVGRITLNYFLHDSNGDAILFVPFLGRWRYLHSWNLWF